MITDRLKIRPILWVVGLAVWWSGLVVLILPALAQAAPLTIVMRDSYGKPLQGVMCEVLSYDWGLKVGEAYAVIARGETDQNGTVTFDVSLWPYSGYRFKFSPTTHMLPADTFFEREDLNQYRGYPAAYVGGKAGTEYFFVAADGLTYNDLSEGNGPPTFQKNPVGGLEQPRLTIMPAQNYLATVKAGTLAAQVSGIPSPTLPPPPPPFKGVSGPLTVTPGAGFNSSVSPISPTSNPSKLATTPNNPARPPTSLSATEVTHTPAQSGIEIPVGNSEDSGNFLESLLLAVVGIVSFGLFLKFRHHFYWLLGLEGRPSKSKKVTRKTTQVEKRREKHSQIRANPTPANLLEKPEIKLRAKATSLPENEPKEPVSTVTGSDKTEEK